MAPRFFIAAMFALALPALAANAQDEKTKPKNGADPMQAVQADLAARKFDDAITKLDAILKDKPKDPQALLILVAVTQDKGQAMLQDRKASIPVFMKSAEAARTFLTTPAAKNLNPRQVALFSTALYNGACTLAIDGKPEKAVAMLKEAFDAGFAEYATFEKDEELDSLRKRDDFKALEASLKDKKEGKEKKKDQQAKVDVPKLLKENKAFPFSFTLPDLDDKNVSLDDYKGKVVIVDFWATWCAPCLMEMPHFAELSRDYKAKGLEIVGINYEEGTPAEGKKTLKTYLDENKVPFKCVIGDEKTQMQVPDFEGYPTTLFIDRAGKVRLKLEAYQEKAVFEEIVKTLLDEKAN